ncbi:MAG: NAD-binding protein [Phycisphaerales bacterium]|nr:NAD-binding protein [Phycisphaerales bacterium]
MNEYGLDIARVSHAMPLHDLNLGPRRGVWRDRLWREWCFARAVTRKIGPKFALFALVLLIGSLMFQRLGPRQDLSIVEGMYNTWSLVFAQPPIDFPSNPWLRGLFFAVPILGIGFIIDTLVEVVRLLRDRRGLEQSWSRIMAASMQDHIIIVGMGKLGFRSFQILRRLGHRVVAIEIDPTKQFVDEVRAEGSPILIGDARREGLLLEAGVAKARAIMVATSDDLANLEIALDARRVAPNVRVVLRMFDQSMADKVAGAAGIHVAMSQSWLSAPAFATAAVEPGVVGSLVVGDRLIAMQRWAVRRGGALDGLSIADAMSKHSISIIELVPAAVGAGASSAETPPGGRDALFPRADAVLRAGDRVMVQGRYNELAALRPAAAE